MTLNTNGPSLSLPPGLDYTLGVATMLVGVNHIDGKGGEFHRRLYAWERLMGAMGEDDNGPLYLSSLDLPEGYQTNASPMTETQFWTHLQKQFKSSVVL